MNRKQLMEKNARAAAPHWTFLPSPQSVDPTEDCAVNGRGKDKRPREEGPPSSKNAADKKLKDHIMQRFVQVQADPERAFNEVWDEETTRAKLGMNQYEEKDGYLLVPKDGEPRGAGSQTGYTKVSLSRMSGFKCEF